MLNKLKWGGGGGLKQHNLKHLKKPEVFQKYQPKKKIINENHSLLIISSSSLASASILTKITCKNNDPLYSGTKSHCQVPSRLNLPSVMV